MDDAPPPDFGAVPRTPVVFAGRPSSAGTRRFTDRHAALLQDPRLHDNRKWSGTALWACLEHLRVSTVTQAAQVAVLDAWVDGADAFCVLYRPPFDGRRVVGLRRRRQEAVEAREWRLGDMTTWGYDMGSRSALDGSNWVDPVAFGWNVADFDIGEPLGFVATMLRYDDSDGNSGDESRIGWWGSLGVALPRPPQMAK